MNKIRELETQIAEERRVAQHQRVLDLEQQHQQAIWNAGAARKEVEGLLAHFRDQEAKRNLAHEAYLDYQAAIAALESEYQAVEFPTKDETVRYMAERDRLAGEMEQKRRAYVKLKHELEPMRLNAVLADQRYLELARLAQNIENQLHEAREKEKGTSNDSHSGPMVGFIPTHPAEKASPPRTRVRGRESLL